MIVSILDIWIISKCNNKIIFPPGESSLNMTRGGMKILRGLRNFLDPKRGALKKLVGASENLYSLKPTGEGGS